MIKTVLFYECDLCKREAESKSNPLGGWIILPEDAAVCPYCVEAIRQLHVEADEKEEARYQEALENPMAKEEFWGDFNKARFLTTR